MLTASLFYFALAPLSARPIATGINGLTCDLQKLDADQTEAFLFNKETARFMKAAPSSQAGWNKLINRFMDAQKEKNSRLVMQNLHTLFAPYKVIITNNTQQTIVVKKSEYIGALKEAIVNCTDIVSFYPNFNDSRNLSYVFSAFFSLFSGAFITAGIGGAIDKKSKTIHKKIGYGLLGLGLGTACAVGAGLLFKVGAWAQKLQKKKQCLKQNYPQLHTSKNRKKGLKNLMLGVKPGQTLTDTILVNTESPHAASEILENTKKISLISHHTKS